MSRPITEPGWYRLGARGLERVAGLDEDPPPGLPEHELVRGEVDPQAVEEPLF